MPTIALPRIGASGGVEQERNKMNDETNIPVFRFLNDPIECDWDSVAYEFYRERPELNGKCTLIIEPKKPPKHRRLRR